MYTMLFFELDRPSTFADIIVSADLGKGLQREPTSKLERSRQAYDSRHMLFNYQLAPIQIEIKKELSTLCRTPKGKISTWRKET